MKACRLANKIKRKSRGETQILNHLLLISFKVHMDMIWLLALNCKPISIPLTA